MSVSKVYLSVVKPYVNANKKFNPNFTAQQSTSVFDSNKKNSNKSLLFGLGLLALGTLVYWKREALGLSRTIKVVAKKTNTELEAKIKQLKITYMSDAHRVLGENTHNNIVNLSAIEPAAAMRSASKTEHEPFHQAASWIEEAYKDAYSKAELRDGNNILNYIYKRVASENNTLAKMYAQMPKDEAQIRVKLFAVEATEKDKHIGLTVDKFVDYMINKLVPKAKQDLIDKV